MQSESAVAAVPSAADTWSNVNNFTVPAGVKRLVKVIGSVAPDPGALAQMHVTTFIRLTGSGLLEQSPHQYFINGTDQSITAANSGTANVEPDVIEYAVDIPVQTGGQIIVDQIDINEVPAAQTTRVMLVYDNGDVQAKNQMADYVSQSTMPAADTWTTVGTLTVPQLKPENSPTAIDEIVCGLVPDEAGNTLIRNSSRFRLTGSGLNEGGKHEYLGNAKGTMWTTPGGQAVMNAYKRYSNTALPVNSGGQILVEAIIDSEVPAGGTLYFAVRYK